jgi:hypothetical protein
MSGIIEQMQAEIAKLKAKVETIEGANRIATILERHKVEGEYLPVKSPQQRRDEIVEQAKRDVDYLKDVDGLYTVESGSEFNYACYSEFIVNKEKRTVVALLRGFRTKWMRAKGFAKCAPQDCFNAHIGKAIALRRALGLEVPDEYLNAPQPTEVRVGDVILSKGNTYKITDSFGAAAYLKGYAQPGSPAAKAGKVIDDSREEVTE